jgi:hypothetical protein
VRPGSISPAEGNGGSGKDFRVAARGFFQAARNRPPDRMSGGRAFAAQGLGRFMVETDAPYLTPMPHRGKPNEPAYLRHTAEYAAKEVFRVGIDELETITTATARRFFGLA